MIRNIICFVLICSSVYSKDMSHCRKIGEVINNINNMPLYSTSLYMCVELPVLTTGVSKDFINLKNLSNSSITTLKNYTIIKNTTENISTYPDTPYSTPSPSVTYNTHSLMPSPTPVSPTPVSPTPVSPTPSSEPSETPSSEPSETITIPDITKTMEDIEQIIILEENVTKNNSSNIVPPEDNTILISMIVVSSVIVISCCCAFKYKYKRGHKIFTTSCNKTQKKEPDIETGEKTVKKTVHIDTISDAQRKLKTITTLKKGRIKRKKQNMVSKIPVALPPPPTNSPPKFKSNKNMNKRKSARETMMETAANMPGGQDNPRFKQLMKKFPEKTQDVMDNDTQKWYKKKFNDELTVLDVITNKPLTTLPITKIITGGEVISNPNNSSSPKMIINEIK